MLDRHVPAVVLVTVLYSNKLRYKTVSLRGLSGTRPKGRVPVFLEIDDAMGEGNLIQPCDMAQCASGVAQMLGLNSIQCGSRACTGLQSEEINWGFSPDGPSSAGRFGPFALHS